MTDNVTANAGSGGPVFATDEIGGVHYPRSKVVFGADGVATDVSAANPMPVTNPTSLPLPSGAAQDGTDGTGITPPTGGSGIRGWLSGIFQKLSNALAVTQSGAWSVGRTWTLSSSSDSVAVTGTFYQATQPVSLASLPALPSGSNFVGNVAEAYSYSQISASAAVKSSAGTLGGFIVSSSASGTVTIYDNTAGSGTKILDTMSVTAGNAYPIPASFSTGCYVSISGTASITVFYR